MDLMCDIETLGTGYNSVITQIGMVYFDRITGDIGDTFLINISIKSCLSYGMDVDSEALEFWFAQKDKSFLEETVDLPTALFLVQEFYKKESIVWAHATFDFPIIANAYKRINKEFAFPYRKLRDIRTLVDLSGNPFHKEGTEYGVKTHNALSDCLFQIKYCMDCFRVIVGKGKK